MTSSIGQRAKRNPNDSATVLEGDSSEDDGGDAGTEGEVDVRETLALQLIELEMMRSMYGKPGEFQVEEDQAELAVQAFLDGVLDYAALDSRVGFTVNITSHDCKDLTVQLVARLPHKYPHLLPEVYLRVPQMSREDLSCLNEDLQMQLRSLEAGELRMGLAIQWLQEKMAAYVQDSPSHDLGCGAPIPAPKDARFTRLWVYSHHIFSKFKRRDILNWAHELKFSGFSMPGKPGVICVEGGYSAVEDFWYRLRNMNWKRIVVREKEVLDIPADQTEDSLRKFQGFEERGFAPRGGKGREYHADMGLFYDFLEEHGCGKVFSLFFGVEGKASAQGQAR